MIDKLEVINFLQDFGCARLRHLQILFNSKNDNFNSILNTRCISKKDDIFVHNNSKIDERMLTALDVLCKYKNRLNKYYIGYNPIYITFLTKDNTIYHIIVADEYSEKGVVKQINNSSCLPEADKLILLFKDENQLNNINCQKPFLYCTYPDIKIIN